MSGEGDVRYDDPTLKGIGRYFNNSTIKGRANVSMATLAALGLFGIYKALFGGKKKEKIEI